MNNLWILLNFEWMGKSINNSKYRKTFALQTYVQLSAGTTALDHNFKSKKALQFLADF
jgi:hypothetical protein